MFELKTTITIRCNYCGYTHAYESWKDVWKNGWIQIADTKQPYTLEYCTSGCKRKAIGDKGQILNGIENV